MTTEQAISLSEEQQRWATSRPELKHIKGAAGCGKTLILGNRTVSALTAKRVVLATCFNITMRNYLRDVINIVRRAKNMPRVKDAQMRVQHFHRVLYEMAKTCGINIRDDRADDDLDSGFWQRIADEAKTALKQMSPDERFQKGIAQYDSIFIDEGQDFERGWIEILQLMMKPGGQPEMIVMSDPAQNIYDKDVSRDTSLPGFIGKPPVLKTSYRQAGRIASVSKLWLAHAFGSDFETSPEFQQTLFDESKIRWTNVESDEAVADIVIPLLKKYQRLGIVWGDIAVICDNNCVTRAIFDELAKNGIPTQSTIAASEEAKRLSSKDCKTLERQRKLEFGRKGGKVKLTTIHSFKGWEWSHVILILGNSNKDTNRMDDSDSASALIYTGITRAIKSLHVINCRPSISDFALQLKAEGLLDE